MTDQADCDSHSTKRARLSPESPSSGDTAYTSSPARATSFDPYVDDYNPGGGSFLRHKPTYFTLPMPAPPELPRLSVVESAGRTMLALDSGVDQFGALSSAIANAQTPVETPVERPVRRRLQISDDDDEPDVVQERRSNVYVNAEAADDGDVDASSLASYVDDGGESDSLPTPCSSPEHWDFDSLASETPGDDDDADADAVDDLYSDTPRSPNDDDDSFDSLADFIEDDDGMPEEADEALAELRCNNASSFALLIYYVVRCVADKKYVERLYAAKGAALYTELMVLSSRSATRMWQAPGDRASALMESAVWMESLHDDLRSHCVASMQALEPTDPHYGVDCTVCRRAGHPITYRLDLVGRGVQHEIGGDYDGADLYEDVMALARIRNDPSGDDTPITARSVRSIYCGRNCAERLFLYHRLAHFWLMTGWSCYKWVEARRRDTKPRRKKPSPKKLAEQVRNGKAPKLLDMCYQDYQDTLREADEYRAGFRGISAFERMD